MRSIFDYCRCRNRKPSQACEAMEMGAAAVMANTAIATAGDIPAMAEAFKKAIEAGKKRISGRTWKSH